MSRGLGDVYKRQGFERIFGILMDNGYEIPGQKKRIAVFYDPDTYAAALQYAEELRSEYLVSTIARPKKLGKFLNRLETAGYDGFAVYGRKMVSNCFPKE